MRLEPCGAGGLPRGHGRWEHSYVTALHRGEASPKSLEFYTEVTVCIRTDTRVVLLYCAD